MAVTSNQWGRVEDDGTVYVRTGEGAERAVGQYAAGSPEEALAFFTQRFEALAAEVELLEGRVNAQRMAPQEATESVRSMRAQVTEANAVGDLAALGARLDALGPVVALQRQAKKAEDARRVAETVQAKEALVAQAEQVGAGTDWRGGGQRLRDLLDQWKALPRLDRRTDDALWQRYAAARSAYHKARKVHHAEMDEKRAGARVVKERLVKEAEALSGSTDWGPTSGKYRDLMRDWKAAGPAPREVEDTLWQRFRAAQDVFFGARDAANAEQDKEFAQNAEVKEALLVEAEALLPITDLDAAKKSFRAISERWDEAGKVPRDRIKELDGRIRKVEQAIRGLEDEQWRRSDPEKSRRADGMVAQLEAAITKVESDLEKARAAGDERKARDLENDLASRQAFLDMARRASADYSR